MTKSGGHCGRLGCSGLLVLLLAAGVHAQDLPDPPSYILHHGIDGGWLECDGTVDCSSIPGERGVWFEQSIAKKLVEEHKAAADIASLVVTYEEKTKLIETRLALCKESEGLAVAETHGFEDAILDATAQKRAAEARAEEAIASRDAWYNAKVLWFGGGLLSAIALLGLGWAISG